MKKLSIIIQYHSITIITKPITMKAENYQAHRRPRNSLPIAISMRRTVLFTETQ